MSKEEIKDAIEKLNGEIQQLECSDSPYKYQSISVCKAQLESAREQMDAMERDETVAGFN